MRERKYIKVSVAMYDDTKLKIIDRRPNRDLTHYVWNRVMVLAGKCNQEGDLYMSRTIPYAVETLAIEFNREPGEVKSALEVLIELEMIEVTEDGVYRVTNFAKHQSIKVKEKQEIKDTKSDLKNNEKEADLKVGEVQEAKILTNENSIKEVQKVDCARKQKQLKKETVNKINKNETKNVKKKETSNLEINQKAASNVGDSLTKGKYNNLQDSIPIFSEMKNNKRSNKKKKVDEIFEFNLDENENNQIDGIHDVERPLGKGERIIKEFLVFD